MSITYYDVVTEVWCNGSTRDFGSFSLGSNPGTSTKFIKCKYYVAFNRLVTSYINNALLEV